MTNDPVAGPGWPKVGRRPPKIEAMFDSICPECGEEIDEGDTLYWSEHHDAYVCNIACR